MKKMLPFVLLFCIFSLTTLVSCQKDAHFDSNADEEITDTTIFIDITLDGKRTLGIQKLQPNQKYGQWYLVWGGAQLDSGLWSSSFQGASLQKTELLPMLSFTKGNIELFRKDPVTDTFMKQSYQEFSAFFATGTYPYSVYGNDTVIHNGSSTYTYKLLTDGIVLRWQDENNVVWQTYGAGADQTGSSFTITDSKPSGNIANDIIHGCKVTASFNCKLYDGKGHVKQLTNGRFRLGIWL